MAEEGKIKGASSKASHRLSLRKRKRNLIWRARMEKILKEKDKKDLSQIYSILDKAAKAGIIAKNKANRLKAKIAKKIKSKAGAKISQPTSPPGLAAGRPGKKPVKRKRAKVAPKKEKKTE